jgi:hypothetical protein
MIQKGVTKRAPSSLGAVLGGSRELQTPAGQVSLAVWLSAVGSRIADRARPEKLSRGTLWVRVSSSTWAQELSLQSQLIVSRLQAAGFPVQELRFRVGMDTSSTPKKPTAVASARRAPLPASLEKSLAKLEDPALKAAIADAAAFSLGRRRRGPTR